MENELKPCPFCGSKKLCVSFDDYNNSIVYCRKCGAEGPKIDRGPCYEDEAIEAWNRRAEEE